MLRFLVATAVAVCAAGAAASQQPALPDTSAIGPQVGAVVPDFSGVDQFGKSHTLQSSMGPKGAMLVFFRSADW